MLDTKFRSTFQKALIDPVIKLHIFSKINPNLVTLLSLIFGILTFVLIILKHPIYAATTLLLSGYFDVLDGSIARKNQKESDLGCVLDIFSDRLVEMLIITSFFIIHFENGAFKAFLMLSSAYVCITSFLVVAIFEKNVTEKSFKYSFGLIERGEVFIFFVLMILFENLFTFLAISFSVLVFLTAFLRIFEFYKNYQSQKMQS